MNNSELCEIEKSKKTAERSRRLIDAIWKLPQQRMTGRL